MKTSGFITEENRKIVASVPSTATPTLVKRGVAPLRAGEGHSFLLRRLHSLSGIVPVGLLDRKSTRLNSSHPSISYAVFCLKKKRLKASTPVTRIAYVVVASFREIPPIVRSPL